MLNIHIDEFFFSLAGAHLDHIRSSLSSLFMETLTSLSTKIFTKNYGNKTRSSKTLLGRSDVRLLRSLHINDCPAQSVASCRVASDTKVPYFVASS